jgi:hypothetical protein
MERQEHLCAPLFNAFEEQLTGQEFDLDHQEEALHFRWRRAETVLQLLTQGVQGGRLGECRTPPIEL